MSTATTPPLAGAYAADPIHSSFGFRVGFQGVSVFRGTLTDVSATLTAGRLEGSARVESISIRAPEAFRASVMGPDFFDATGHPELTFVSTRTEFREDGSAVVEGELTIKGITRPVTTAGAWTAPMTDAFGQTRGHLQLEATVDRTEFDMRWNAPLPSGGVALAHDVTLDVEVSLIEVPSDA
jgi:polyisoprenoid-binding protein YceI